MITWKIEKRNIEDLQGYDKNPRKFTDKGLKDLKKSLQNCGDANIITINADNTVLGGHARLTVMKQLGYTEVDVKVPEKQLSEKQVQEVVVRLNANTAGEWDLDKLQADFELDELQEWGLDIEFETLEEEKEIVEDEVPEEVETRAKRGDIWLLGNHRLMCGDSTSVTDVEKLMNGEKADLLLTDPPYNVDYSAKNKFLNKYDKGNRVQKDIENDKKTAEEFYNFLYSMFSNAYNYIKDGACFYVFYPNAEFTNFHNALNNSLLKVHQYLVWCKNNHVLGMNDYQYKHEPIFYGWKEGKHNWYSDRSQTTVLNFNKPLKNDLHPTMKPIEILAYLLTNSTNKTNNKVLDLFGGSGSTLIACEQLNRKCFMMELDEHYCDVIITRWENLTGQKAVLCS